MQFCAVRGCGSNSADSTYKFHPLPKSLIRRARWLVALGPLRRGYPVCSLHFGPDMYQGGKLMLNSVPKPFENVPPKYEVCSDLDEFPEEEGSTSNLVACRVCLVATGRLYAIGGSDIEDSFAKLTGVTAAKEKMFPRYLCAFCLVKLSKCAAFRDSCQRSTAVLQTLLETGRLNMNVIKAIDRDAHQLGNDLTTHTAFQIQTDRLWNTPTVFKTETEDTYDGDDSAHYTEVEYLDSKDVLEEAPILDASEEDTSDMENIDTLENIDTHLEATGEIKDKVIVENVNTDVEMEPPSVINIFSVKTGSDRYGNKYNFTVRGLSKMEQKQKVEERKRDNKTPFCCALCGKGCVSASSLRNHNMDCHNPSLPFVCDVCGHRFRRRKMLRYHQADHGALLTCNQCGYVTHRRLLARHHYSLHKGKKHTCPHCQAQFDRASTYYLHVKMRHPAHSEACDECGETFKGAAGLKTHKRLQHPKIAQDFKCTVCEVTFLSVEALERHEELSEGVSHDELFPCGACGDSCGSDVARAAHMVEKHPPDQHYCKECDKTFSGASAFDLHADRKHRNVRPKAKSRPPPAPGAAPRAPDAPAQNYVCDRCGKSFHSRTPLEYHMNIHLGLNPFQCSYCFKAFPSPIKLKVHLRVHTGERPYQCDQCPKAFSNKGNLDRHVKDVHLRVQKCCDQCGKKVGASSLKAHIRAVHLRIPVVRRKRDRPKKKRDLGTEF